MCNGWNHNDGCQCGFGPPYNSIRTVRYKVPSEKGASNTSIAGRFLISAPVSGIPKLDDLDEQLKSQLVNMLEESIRLIAKKSFRNIQISEQVRLDIKIRSLSEGSINIDFTLVVVGGLVYSFFKDYESLRKGIMLFLNDILAASRHIAKLIRKIVRKKRK
jgi:hypothetical protein